MDFDVIITNPPFSWPKDKMATRDTGSGALWPLFMQKAFKHLRADGIMAWIVPKRLATMSEHIKKGGINCWSGFIKEYDIIQVNLGECSRQFKGVGRSDNYFCYTVWQKRKSAEPVMTKIILPACSFAFDIRGMDYLPLNATSILDFHITRKIQALVSKMGGYRFGQAGQHTIQPTCRKVGFRHVKEIYSSYDNCFMTDYEGIDWRKHKADGTNEFKARFIPIPDEATAEIIDSVFKSDLFRYMGAVMNDGVLDQYFQRCLPRLSLTRLWTNSEIIAAVGLTHEEADHVRAVVAQIQPKSMPPPMGY